MRAPARPTGRPEHDAGQASVAMIPVVVGLVAIALLFLAPLGSAGVQRTKASTAADAAALAAAQTWADRLNALATGSPVGLPADPGGFLGAGALDGAERFAGRNDADLVAFAVVPGSGPPQFQVTVRSRTAVAGTPTHVTAKARATVVFGPGTCWLPPAGVGEGDVAHCVKAAIAPVPGLRLPLHAVLVQ